jgi:PAS domain S-box-containing protein
MTRKPTYEELEQRVKELERESLERKREEADIIGAKDFYQTILDGIINGVWVTDKDDVIYYTNKGMGIIAGIPQEQIVGARVLDDFPESTLKFFRPYYLKTKETLQPVYYDAVPVRTPAGRQSYQSGWLIPRIKDNRFDGMICTVEDVTDRKNAEDALRKAHDELERRVEERTAELTKANEALEAEIVERKRAQEALQESEARLQSIIRVAPIGIGVVSDRVIQTVNDRFCEMVGFSREELIGQSARVVYPSDEEFERVGSDKYADIRKYGTGSIETKFMRKDGQVIDVLLSSAALNPDNLSEGVTFTVLDLTERKQAEEGLRESEEKFRTFMETASDLMHMADKDGNITYVNESMARTLGYSKEEMIGMHITQVISKESLKNFKPDLEELITKGGISLEVAWVTKDGKEICVEGRVVGIYDSDGKFAGSRAVFRDITERKRMQEELQESEELFRQFFENEPEYCYMISPEGVILNVNKAALKVLGYKKEELVSKPLKMIYAPESLPKTKQFFLKWGKTGKIKDEELVIITKKGNRRTVLLSAGVVKDKDGKILHSVSVQKDITERKRVEQALQQERDNLQDALAKVKTLSGLLPICANCKKIRDDKGYWNQIEAYIRDHSEADFSHSICPECAKKLYPEFYKGD